MAAVDLVDLANSESLAEKQLLLAYEDLELGKHMVEQGIEVGGDDAVDDGFAEQLELVGEGPLAGQPRDRTLEVDAGLCLEGRVGIFEATLEALAGRLKLRLLPPDRCSSLAISVAMLGKSPPAVAR